MVHAILGVCSPAEKECEARISRIAWTRCSTYQHMLNENLTLKKR